MHSVCVKGDAFTASSAANARGIKATEFVALSATTTVLVVEDHYINKIIKWFCEPTTFIDGFGYANGTILFYAYQEQKQLPQGSGL